MSEPLKSGIDQLLIASALDADLLRRLVETPDEAFQGFELTEEEKNLLRRPDHRLLSLLGAALSHERHAPAPVRPAEAAAPQPHSVVEAPALPDVTLVLTLVPCAQIEGGKLHRISYAVWVNPLPPGADPASLPPPPGAVFPGQPLPALHAVIQVSALAMEDAAGAPLIGLSATFRKASNVSAPPPVEAAGRAKGSVFGSDVSCEEVQTAIAAVRSAPAGQRYGKLIELMHTLRERDGR